MKTNWADTPLAIQNLEEILQAFSDLSLVVDADGIILECKPGYFLTPGISEIVPGRKIQEVFSVGMVEKFEQALSISRETGKANAFGMEDQAC